MTHLIHLLEGSKDWDVKWNNCFAELKSWQRELANAQERTALSSATPIEPTSLFRPSGLQSHFAERNAA